MTVEVYPLRLSDAPSEVWYGVRANGTDLRAGWADPDAARRAGERHIRELRERLSKSSRGGNVETQTPDAPATPDVEPEEEPKLPDPDTEENDGDGEDDDAEE